MEKRSEEGGREGWREGAMGVTRSDVRELIT